MTQKEYNNFEDELTDLVVKYTDKLQPIQIIALLEVKKLTLAHLHIMDVIEHAKNGQ